MTLRIYLAGRVAIEGPAAVVTERDLPSRQGRVVLALLVTEQPRRIPRDEIATELWPDQPPPSSDKAIAALISKLRTVLARVGLDGDVIEAAYGGYRLCLPPDVWVDQIDAAQQLEVAETFVRDGEPLAGYGAAHVALYVLERRFLDGEDGPWVTARREQLRLLLLRALAVATVVNAANGEHDVAIRQAERAVAIDPFRESAWRQLISSYASNGDTALALQAYNRCRRTLDDEFGIRPSPATEALYLDLLQAT